MLFLPLKCDYIASELRYSSAERTKLIGKELIYDESLSKFERFYIMLFGVPINGLRNRARRILPLISKKYKNIMDAGCGQGIFTFEIARRLPESSITGIDIEAELLERNRQIAEKIGLKNCHFEFQDITKMEIEKKYDLIFSVDNLEHIQDDDNALRNFYYALIPNGELILHVPGYYRRWFFFKWKVNFNVEGHYRPGYTKEEIVRKLKNAGFNIVESYYTYGWLETITNNISYLITGARMRNKYLYALVFPILLFISYFGRNSRPSEGAGVLVIAKR